jgi:prepilin-type N-terminal cleavage/methylation domain-containing protein
MRHKATRITDSLYQETKTKQAGFTLLEIVAVLGITLLISAFAFPQLNRYRHAYRLDSAVQTLASNLEMARYSAISKNVDVVVLFDVTQSSYQFFADKNGNGIRDGNELLVGPYPLPAQVQFRGNGLLGPPSGPTGPVTDPISFSNDRIVLNSQGKLNSGLGSIYLQNYSGDAAAISFNIAGRMKIFRWDKSSLIWK